MFITCDRVPLIIGQIFDVHPEALIVKPYTIHSFIKNILNSINLHKYLMPVYEMVDNFHHPSFRKQALNIYED